MALNNRNDLGNIYQERINSYVERRDRATDILTPLISIGASIATPFIIKGALSILYRGISKISSVAFSKLSKSPIVHEYYKKVLSPVIYGKMVNATLSPSEARHAGYKIITRMPVIKELRSIKADILRTFRKYPVRTKYARKAFEYLSNDVISSPIAYIISMNTYKKESPEDYKKYSGIKGAAKWYVDLLPYDILSSTILGKVIQIGVVAKELISSKISRSTILKFKSGLGSFAVKPLLFMKGVTSYQRSPNTDIKTYIINAIKAGNNVIKNYIDNKNRYSIAPEVRELLLSFSSLKNENVSESDFVKEIINMLESEKSKDLISLLEDIESSFRLYQSEKYKVLAISSKMSKSKIDKISRLKDFINNPYKFSFLTTVNTSVTGEELKIDTIDMSDWREAKYAFLDLMGHIFSFPTGKRFGRNFQLLDLLGTLSHEKDKIKYGSLYAIRGSEIANRRIKINKSYKNYTSDIDIFQDFFLSDFDGIKLNFDKSTKEFKTLRSLLADKEAAKKFITAEGLDKKGLAIRNLLLNYMDIDENLELRPTTEFKELIGALREGWFTIGTTNLVVKSGRQTYLYIRGKQPTITEKEKFYELALRVPELDNIEFVDSFTPHGKALVQMFSKRALNSIYGFDTETIRDNPVSQQHDTIITKLRKKFNIDTTPKSIWRFISNMIVRYKDPNNVAAFIDRIRNDKSFRETVNDIVENAIYTTKEDIKNIANVMDQMTQVLTLTFGKMITENTEVLGKADIEDNILGKMLRSFMISSDMGTNEILKRIQTFKEFIKDSAVLPNDLKNYFMYNISKVNNAFVSGITTSTLDSFVRISKSIGSTDYTIADLYHSLILQAGAYKYSKLSFEKQVYSFIGKSITENISSKDVLKSIFNLLEKNQDTFVDLINNVTMMQSDILSKGISFSRKNFKELISFFTASDDDPKYAFSKVIFDKMKEEFWNVINIQTYNPLIESAKSLSGKIAYVAGEYNQTINASLMTAISHVNNTLNTLGLGFVANYSSPGEYLEKLITQRVITGSLIVSGAYLADSFFRSNPIFDGTILDRGFSGLAWDIYAKTKIMSYELLENLGIQQFAASLEEKYPGMIDSPLSGALRGFGPVIAGMKIGGLSGLGIGAGVGLVLGGLPLGILGDWNIAKTKDDIIAELSGRKDVPIRRGRFWMLSWDPLQGTGIEYYRPHLYAVQRSEYDNAVNSRGLIPERVIGTILPDHYTYRDFYTRPYPMTKGFLSGVPVVGSIIPLSKRLKHENESPIIESVEQNIGYYSPDNVSGILENGLLNATNMLGLTGFVAQELTGIGDPTLMKEIQKPNRYTLYSDFWEKDLGDPLMGLCLSGDTLIETNFGLKKIKDIKPGDYVVNSSGQLSLVKNVIITPYKIWKRRGKRILKVVNSLYNIPLYITDNHVLPIYSIKNGCILNINAKDLKPGDYVLHPIITSSSYYYKPLFNSHKYEMILSYICGLFFSSSEYTIENDSLKFKINCSYIDLIMDIISDINDCCKLYIDYDNNYIILKSKEFIDFIKKNLLTTDGNKYISYNIKASSDDFIRMFVKGFFEGANINISINKSSISFTEYESLISFIDILFRIGVTFNIKKYTNGAVLYKVIFSNNILKSIIEYIYNKKNIDRRNVDNKNIDMIYLGDDKNNYTYVLLRVSSVSRYHKYKDQVYDIELDNNHYFLANNILVHNTEPLRRFITKKSSEMAYYNPIPNTVAPAFLSLTGKDFFTGDIYSKVKMGEIRLPGPAYEHIRSVKKDFPLSGYALGLNREQQIAFYLGEQEFMKHYNKLRAESETILKELKTMYAISGSDVAYNKDYNFDATVDGFIDYNGERLPLVIGNYKVDTARLNAYLVMKKKKMGLFYDIYSRQFIYITPNERAFITNLKNLNQTVDEIKAFVMSKDFIKLRDKYYLTNAYSHEDRARILADIAPYSDALKNEFKILLANGNRKLVSDLKKLIESKNGIYDFKEYKYLGKPLEGDILEYTIGSIWETIAHNRNIISTKLIGHRSAIEVYEQQYVYGQNFKNWADPFGTMLFPIIEGAIIDNNLLNSAGLMGSIGYMLGGQNVAIPAAAIGIGSNATRQLLGIEPVIDSELNEIRNIHMNTLKLQYMYNKYMYRSTGNEYYKFMADSNILSSNYKLNTANLGSNLMRADVEFAKAFMNVSDVSERKRILKAVGPDMQSILLQKWYGIKPSIVYDPALISPSFVSWNPSIQFRDLEINEIELRGLDAHRVGYGFMYDKRRLYTTFYQPAGFSSKIRMQAINLPPYLRIRNTYGRNDEEKNR